MHYWIDGYNLLFKLSLKGSLESRRKELIQTLDRKAKELGLSISIVFDAKEESDTIRTHYGEIEILYTPSKQTADEVILQRLETVKKRESICLVTEDKSLANQARLLRAKTLSVFTFLTQISKKKRKKSPTIPKDTPLESPSEIARLLALFEERLGREEEF